MTNTNLPVTIGIADDHTLVRNAIATLINRSPRYRVTIEAGNGKELLDRINKSAVPDIILLDINMPVMNGFETVAAIQKRPEKTSVIALTVLNDQDTVFRLYHAGISGYILKTAEPDEFFHVLESVVSGDTCFPEPADNKLNRVPADKRSKIMGMLNERELAFLKYAAMDISYNEIARRMNLSRFTINDYRNSLYEKFDVHTRIGLVLLAAKLKMVEI